MTTFSGYFYFTFVLAYSVDSYTSNVSEMLIAMNLGKQAISFGMGLKLLEWVVMKGYAVMIAGVFGGLLLVNNGAVVGFLVGGKRLRGWMAGSWLAGVHGGSARDGETH